MRASTAAALQRRRLVISPDEFRRRSVAALHRAEIPFLIGGAYVVEVYAGVSRSTKDFDLYVRPHHVKLALAALARRIPNGTAVSALAGQGQIRRRYR